MAIDPKTQDFLRKLMTRPETLSDTEVVPETDNSDKFKIEAPAEEYKVPEEIADQVNDVEESESSPEVAQESDIGENFKVESPAKTYQPDSDITEMIRKLKAGKPASQEVEITPETISDPSASPELRKAALEKVKQKYLGK